MGSRLEPRRPTCKHGPVQVKRQDMVDLVNSLACEHGRGVHLKHPLLQSSARNPRIVWRTYQTGRPLLPSLTAIVTPVAMEPAPATRAPRSAQGRSLRASGRPVPSCTASTGASPPSRSPEATRSARRWGCAWGAAGAGFLLEESSMSGRGRKSMPWLKIGPRRPVSSASLEAWNAALQASRPSRSKLGPPRSKLPEWAPRVRTSRSKLGTGHPSFRTGRLGVRVPHSKLGMPHSKLRAAHSKLRAACVKSGSRRS
jgi:hypothetical protein